MNFSRGRKRERQLAEISVIPLIDLFLNILVFFLVTTTFGSDSVFFVELPQASATDQGGTSAKQFIVSINDKGGLALNQKKIDREQLTKELEKIEPKNRKSFPVLLRADKSAMHGEVVSIIDIIRNGGYQNVGIVTKLELGKK